MGKIIITRQIDAAIETVFAYVDDHKNTTKYMKGLTRWAPTTDVTHGKDAEFEVAMKAGPKTLNSVVHITAWTENKTIAWKSIAGFQQTGKWAFAKKGDGTAATFEMDYDLGGGIAGRMLARAVEPVVKGNIEHSVEALKGIAEKLPAKKSATKKPAGKAATKTSAAKAPARKPTRKR